MSSSRLQITLTGRPTAFWISPPPTTCPLSLFHRRTTGELPAGGWHAQASRFLLKEIGGNIHRHVCQKLVGGIDQDAHLDAGAAAEFDHRRAGGDELHDIARVKLIGVAFLAEDHRRLQGTRVAGSPMGDKMKIRKLFRIALEECGGRGAHPLQHSSLCSGEVFLHLLHFDIAPCT